MSSYKELKPLMSELKTICGVPTLEDAEYHLEEFCDKWGKKYPQILRSWDANWAELITYVKYLQEVRTLIYTTNAVEGFHRMLRKFIKTKTIYPTNDEAGKNGIFSIVEISRKWTMPVRNWGIIIGQLSIFFEDRLQGIS